MHAPAAVAAAPTRVLLVNLNHYDQPYPVYPLGLAYLHGAMREAGHDSRLWDARMAKVPVEDAIAEFMPDVVALSMRNVDNVQLHNPKSFIQEVAVMCRRVRLVTRAKLVLGGSGFSVFPRELFELTGVDFGIQGEGEPSLVKLVEALRHGTPYETIPGLHYREADGRARRVPTNPNDVAFTNEPYHEPELLRAYLAEGSLPGLQTQRGCPLRCTYCTYPLIEGKRSRFRTGPQVVEEMRRLKTLGVKQVFIVDSVFNTRADHVAEICEEIIRSGVGMHWECFLRPRNATRELLALMQRAGLHHVEFGSDSFSDPVLRSYAKSFSYDEILRASIAAHDLKIRYSHFVIFGGPGETTATLEETLRHSTELPGSYFFATLGMRIYPDTPLWRQLAPEKNGESAGDYLLEPRFHLAPDFTLQSLHARILEHQRTHSNWVIGDPPAEFSGTMQKLRRRGVVGSLWEYAELLQRFQAKSA